MKRYYALFEVYSKEPANDYEWRTRMSYTTRIYEAKSEEEAVSKAEKTLTDLSDSGFHTEKVKLVDLLDINRSVLSKKLVLDTTLSRNAMIKEEV